MLWNESSFICLPKTKKSRRFRTMDFVHCKSLTLSVFTVHLHSDCYRYCSRSVRFLSVCIWNRKPVYVLSNADKLCRSRYSDSRLYSKNMLWSLQRRFFDSVVGNKFREDAIVLPCKGDSVNL